MNALAMIAHGSRREEANAEFRALVQDVHTAAGTTYDIVEPCFLEIASPSLAVVVERMVTYGVTDISVFPYFLNSGNHVLRDIPEMVDRLTHQYPHANIALLPYFGTLEGIAALISQRLRPYGTDA